MRHQRPGAPEPVPPAAGGENPGLHGPLPGEVGGASGQRHTALLVVLVLALPLLIIIIISGRSSSSRISLNCQWAAVGKVM